MHRRVGLEGRRLAKRVGVGPASQLWTFKGERYGLWTRNGYGKRFIVRAEEILTALIELQRAIHAFALSLIT